jgi:DNA-binding MarR family transcriptional regulator
MQLDDDEADFPLEPGLEFLQRLWELNRALERRSLQLERTTGVTAQQRVFLRCLGTYPGMTATQLTAVLHLDRGTVSKALARLMARGLVEGKSDKTDRRRVALQLTAKGRALDRPDPRSIERVVEHVLDQVGSTHANRVKAVLSTLSFELTRTLDER